MKNISTTLLIIFTLFSLQSCQNMNKQGAGTLIGGAAGGILGAQFGKGEGQLIATGIGALAGAFVGNSIGKSLDEHDKLMLEKSSRQALEYSPSGSSVEWNNPDSGNRGRITPVKTVKESGQYCREYIQEVVIGGEKKKAYGKACRQPDGDWKIVQ